MKTYELVLCRSDRGDGGWSLHSPGATDEDVASGDAPPLSSGTAKWDEIAGDWDRPDQRDYDTTFELQSPLSAYAR